MDKIKVIGGKTLKGSVKISGAKNSAVALIPASILAESPVTIEGLPEISDVEILKKLLEEIGGVVHLEDQDITIDPSMMTSMPLPNGKVKKLRASYYLMGAMLGRFKKAVIGLPGGCHLGPRPIDQHIKGFEALGAKVTNEQGAIYLRADELKGARIYLDVVSVGATINIMLAAVRAKGKTVIENAAKEPEIIDVATLLTNMGAKIKGAGTDIIRIEGVDHLHGCRHTIIPDRIEAGTYMILASAMGRGVLVDNVIPYHLESLIAKLREMGVSVETSDDQVYISKAKKLVAADIKTLVYPGFPTDLQQPMTALLTNAEGTSVVTDTIYSARFKHIDELRRMNANIKVEGRSAIITGPVQLNGAKVKATDLRAGASLLIAGLMARGLTEITGVEHIDRGYSHVVEKLQGLGANVWRETLTEEEMEQVKNS
ncbi:UDP-N-acetylglucosamine 1-carboxyvinyltransferase 2 [Caldibacillus thermoamylovorans]|jgi:UDP-N-acetylglucosamine 1-carboxyvinyltransferase|uniref:UDP-N-acetylglucosamine 1-carboxyvinyltransferase n=1 Tax=Caldibacillus thermoamylovorans TaxID=35841 RepID=A0A090IYF1_9BACI|nr:MULTISPECIES: UDP-N-acetylglucosamine 1-carboxyvinyltransferase [Bacillaceae]KIO64499.1 UDP-N-acetylglucosamine 1-carboxyvinyltransferase [Caldibacillus thermoamylovorans]KIO64717.1 UDP-N-acetylglucosamine 1-carboxyvinyltransferase [Caldibacillus thermoamylovorans]KIO70907.1 UDP-N-acetylglucosamine 1-carboxyvinyltransferase [Caldibacillus thermoamylovorans]MCM3476807.1 UDP-N-acetylglucosamine 1-carboxyvinyltransferase [Caldibacillus thermoamylovorans]MEC5271244.1 UDP-N-acetylglucosamine 1-c